MLNRKYIFKWWIFHYHVSFQLLVEMMTVERNTENHFIDSLSLLFTIQVEKKTSQVASPERFYILRRVDCA